MAGKFKDHEALFDKRREEERHGVREDREREKPSWRDLDRKRDRSNHSGSSGGERETAPKDRYQDAASQKMLMGQLDALFADKEGSALRAAILAADRASLGEHVAAWIEAKQRFPADDPALLEKALDVRKTDHLLLVVEAVGEHLPTSDAATRKMFLLKLRGKSRTVFDRKVSGRIRQILAEHGDS
jgi:hypothetical protein